MLNKSYTQMKNILLFITFSVLISSCSIPNMVVIELESKSSSQTNGFVVFIEDDSQVTMEATINNLEPGEHAIHIHEKSDCSSNNGKSAGGHPRSRNGIPAKGFKTRSKVKASTKFIVENRKK